MKTKTIVEKEEQQHLAYHDYNVISGVGVWCQAEVRVYDKKVPEVTLALVVRDINPVWPLPCRLWWQCVTQTRIRITLGSSMSLQASQMTCFYKRQPPMWHSEGGEGMCVWESGGRSWNKKKRKKKGLKGPARWKVKTLATTGKRQPTEGHKVISSYNKNMTHKWCRVVEWGLIWRLPFSRHCSLTRSSSRSLISHTSQQHE